MVVLVTEELAFFYLSPEPFLRVRPHPSDDLKLCVPLFMVKLKVVSRSTFSALAAQLCQRLQLSALVPLGHVKPQVLVVLGLVFVRHTTIINWCARRETIPRPSR